MNYTLSVNCEACVVSRRKTSRGFIRAQKKVWEMRKRKWEWVGVMDIDRLTDFEGHGV